MKHANKTKRTLLFAILTGLIISSAYAGVTIDSLKRSFTFKQRLLAEEAASKLMELNLGYEKSLHEKARVTRAQGDLEHYQVWAQEIGRFIKEGPAREITDEPMIGRMQQTYLERYTYIKTVEARRYMELFKSLDRTLAEAESRLTKVGRFLDAKTIRAERASIRETEAYVSARDVLNPDKELEGPKVPMPVTTAQTDPFAVFGE